MLTNYKYQPIFNLILDIPSEKQGVRQNWTFTKIYNFVKYAINKPLQHLKTMKKVSVIIPTYSRPQNLLRAINSVLKQTYQNIEIIVVDDNGKGTPCQQETEICVKDLIDMGKIIYIRHDVNKNGSAARNTGLKACTGDYYTFLDDDDYLYPQKIERQIKALQSNEDCDMVYCGYEKKGDNDVVLSNCNPSKKGNLQLFLLKKSWGFGSGSNPLFTRAVYEKIGLFDESYIRHQDLEYMVRAFRYFKICVVPDILLTKYVNSNSVRPNIRQYEKIKEKFLSDFSVDIEKYGTKEVNKVYRNNWYEMALMAMNEDKKLGLSYVRKAKSYAFLSLKQFLKLSYYILFNKSYGR